MFKSISNWWTAKDREIAHLKQQNEYHNELIVTLRDGNDSFVLENKNLKRNLYDLGQERTLLLKAMQEQVIKHAEELQKLKDAHPDRKVEGELSPWMEIKVDGENELRGLKVSIDWNEAMVQHMKDKGHTYQSENVMMQHFIVQLYEHVIVLLENRTIEESEFQQRNEFE